jgi:enolase-phosphatase E1
LAAHDDDACPSSDATVSHDQPPPPPPRIEDVTALFDAWFDTTTAGLKTEPASYAKIADSLMKVGSKVVMDFFPPMTPFCCCC